MSSYFTSFDAINLFWDNKIKSINPKKGGGLNQHTETLMAFWAVLDVVRNFKPSSRFYFLVFTDNKENDFGGCKKKTYVQKNFFVKIEAIIFENQIFAKKLKIIFFSELNLEYFQLLYVVYIVYINRRL